MIVVGVDPGLGGWVCLLSDNNSNLYPGWMARGGKNTPRDLVCFKKCPTTGDMEDGNWDFDPEGMRKVSHDVWMSSPPGIVVIENQQAFPGRRVKCFSCRRPMNQQGVASTFKTGRGFGLWEMAFRAAGCRVQLVAPQAWKGPMGLSADKDLSIAKAQELAPAVEFRDLVNHPKARKPDHNKCEAFLLAVYAKKLLLREATR